MIFPVAVQVKEIVTPFIEPRAFRWEAHETPNELWTAQGLKPPPSRTLTQKSDGSPKTDHRPTSSRYLLQTDD